MSKSFDKGRKMINLFHKGTRRRPVPVKSDPAADVIFIAGGLKAAFNSQKPVRENVMSDVSLALNCEPKDLDFLFADGTDYERDLNVFDFPDADRRRRFIRDNFADAAE